jgi:ankyrin repeat protein
MGGRLGTALEERMGGILIKVGAWKRCSVLLAASVTLLLQPGSVQRAAAETPAVGSAHSSSASADATAEKIKAAIRKYDDTFVALLIQNPAFADHVYPSGRTLLNEAAFAGNLSAVEALLREGADVNHGKSPPLSLALTGARI